MTNKSTVHLQPAPPLVLTAQEAVARLAAAEARVHTLEAALAPFAALNAHYSDEEDDEYLLNCGDIRRARAALAPETP